MQRKLSICAVLLLSVLLSFSAHSQAFEGKVVSISDGDTISVMHEGAPVKIRLNGIDSPESGQAFGTKARQFVSELAFGQTVTVHEHGKDKYGRVIGEIVLPDGRSLNQEMVRAGFAWWYKEYSGDEELEALELEARAAQKGLWSESSPVPPWEWRRSKTTADKQPEATVVTGGTPTGGTTPTGKTLYVGPRGGIYHISPSGNKVYQKRK